MSTVSVITYPREREGETISILLCINKLSYYFHASVSAIVWQIFAAKTGRLDSRAWLRRIYNSDVNINTLIATKNSQQLIPDELLLHLFITKPWFDKLILSEMSFLCAMSDRSVPPTRSSTCSEFNWERLFSKPFLENECQEGWSLSIIKYTYTWADNERLLFLSSSISALCLLASRWEDMNASLEPSKWPRMKTN
jgi:hypothetical protein